MSSKSTGRVPRGFTLIELQVVIAINHLDDLAFKTSERCDAWVLREVPILKDQWAKLHYGPVKAANPEAVNLTGTAGRGPACAVV